MLKGIRHTENTFFNHEFIRHVTRVIIQTIEQYKNKYLYFKNKLYFLIVSFDIELCKNERIYIFSISSLI